MITKKIAKIGIVSKPCMISKIAKVVSSGNRFYVSLPSLDSEFYGIHKGDLVHITIDLIKTPIQIEKELEE